MSDSVLVSHPPAMKVGGRRLSISSSKHKAQAQTEPTSPTTAKDGSTTDANEPVIDDYPRPAPPTGENVPHQQRHEEEAPPKKERNEKKFQDTAHRKVEMTRPTRDLHSSNRSLGGGMRIAQPAGKALGV